MKIKLNTDHVVDSDVEVVPFAYSDLIKIDVPDTIAGFFSEESTEKPVEVPAVVAVTDSVMTTTTKPVVPLVVDPLALAHTIEVEQLQRVPAATKRSEHDHVIHAVIAIKYSVIALVGGVAAYGVYSVIDGVVGLVSSMATFASHAPAVIGGIIVLLLFARLVNRLTISKVGQLIASRFNGTVSMQHGLQTDMGTSVRPVRTTTVVKKNRIGGIGNFSVIEQPVDELAAQWVDKLRDKGTQQVQGAWRGAGQDDRCAVGHLLEIADPKGWGGDGSGFDHKSFWRLKDRFGKKVLKNAIHMNDSGHSLPQIADYVERQLHKRGQL